MTIRQVATVALGSALLIPLAGIPANAVSDNETTVKDIAMQCYGVKKFDKRPLVDVAGTEIAKGFEDMIACGTIRKLTRKTINSGADVGDIVTYSGYRCEAAKIKQTQPTGGKTKWKCEFRAADTATEIYLKFWQYAD